MSSNNVQAWMQLSKEALAERCVNFELETTALSNGRGMNEIHGMRFALASQFCKGQGIEVGAGDRPFPLPQGAVAMYGDSRDHDELKAYFGAHVTSAQGYIDAETFDGVDNNSADFVISAHVIEHLFNPMGSIRAVSRVLKPSAYAIIAAPEMTETFDRNRPITPISHVIRDLEDAGSSTKLQAYIEHVRFVHPLANQPFADEDVEPEARRIMDVGMDIHVHAWDRAAFIQMMATACRMFGLELVASVSLWNENAVVVRRVNKRRWLG
jgi:SAM-dependent methyltransferase